MRNLVIFLGCLFASVAQAMSLQEAIHTSFEKNPKTQANEMRLRQIRLQAKAAWLDMIPAVTFGYSVGQNSGSTTVDGIAQPNYSSRYSGGSVGASIMLWDPAAIFRAKAADAEVRMQTAMYDSTNALIPNTKGALAGEVQQIYTYIVMNRDLLRLFDRLQTYLEVFYNVAKNQDEKNRILESINNIGTSKTKYQVNLSTFSRSFLDLVTLPVPDTLDPFDSIIESLRIPPTTAKAMEIAALKSPNLQVKDNAIEVAKLNHEAQMASTRMPRIYLNVSRNMNRSSSQDGPLAQSRGTSVGISATWTFDVARFPRNEASAVGIQAAQLERDGQWRDLEHDIDIAYSQYAGSLEQDIALAANLNRLTSNMQDFLSRVESGEDVDLVKYGLPIIGSLASTATLAIMNKMEIIDTKFTIQKKVGTLFEDVNMHLFNSPEGPRH